MSARVEVVARLESRVTAEREQPRHETEQPDGCGGERGAAAPQPLPRERIARPDERRQQCARVTPRRVGLERREAACMRRPRDRDDRAGEAEHPADHVPSGKPRVAQEQRREQHDQQRPQVVDQIRFERRREPERDEQEEVEAEEAIDAEREDARRHAPRAPGRRREHAGRGERRPDQQERRHRRQPHAEPGEATPQHDRAEGQRIRRAGGRVDGRVQCAQPRSPMRPTTRSRRTIGAFAEAMTRHERREHRDGRDRPIRSEDGSSSDRVAGGRSRYSAIHSPGGPPCCAGP